MISAIIIQNIPFFTSRLQRNTLAKVLDVWTLLKAEEIRDKFRFVTFNMEVAAMELFTKNGWKCNYWLCPSWWMYSALLRFFSNNWFFICNNISCVGNRRGENKFHYLKNVRYDISLSIVATEKNYKQPWYFFIKFCDIMYIIIPNAQNGMRRPLEAAVQNLSSKKQNINF